MNGAEKGDTRKGGEGMKAREKSYGEMAVIREIEKAVLIGLKKEGCQRVEKDCELCPLAVWVENEGAWLCKPADLLGTVKGWKKAEKRREKR